MKSDASYHLQLRLIGDVTGIQDDVCQLEVVAKPEDAGPAFCGQFSHWNPVLDEICTFMHSSPFNRKAIQRTLSAGLAADLINRETGKKFGFGPAVIQSLHLKQIAV
jgi:hypothetical protein